MADRAAGFLPPDRLDWRHAVGWPAPARNVRVTATGKFAQRAERIPTIRVSSTARVSRGPSPPDPGRRLTRSYER